MHTIFLSFFLISCASKNNTTATADNIQDNVSDSAPAVQSASESIEHSSTSSHHGQWGLSSIPNDAQPGQCFAKISVPAKIKKVSEQIVVKPESTRIETIPGEYGFTQKTIVTQEAAKKLITVPATYKKVQEKVLVTEASEKLIAVPAKYKWVSEKIMISPPRKEWKEGREWKSGSLATRTGNNGEILCMVEVPAQYKTIKKKVIDTAATTRKIEIPAKYKTITRTVVDRPAHTKEVVIPEKTAQLKVRELIREPSSKSITIPAKYKTITREVLEAPAKDEYHRIVCRTNDKSSIVSQLQSKLKSKGHYHGEVDGIIGPATHRAAALYQKSIGKGYYDGRITFDTLDSLGVENFNI